MNYFTLWKHRDYNEAFTNACAEAAWTPICDHHTAHDQDPPLSCDDLRKIASDIGLEWAGRSQSHDYDLHEALAREVIARAGYVVTFGETVNGGLILAKL